MAQPDTTPQPIHSWGAYSMVWACPDCDAEIPRKHDDTTVGYVCPNCGTIMVKGVLAENHRVYPFDTIEQFKEAFGGDPKSMVIAADGVAFGEGDRAYNYYDRKPGVIGTFDNPGHPKSWFDFHQDDGTRKQLNGERICSLATAKKRGFKDA